MMQASSTPENFDHRVWPMRLWLATPDWAFRIAGVAFFATFLWYRVQKYWTYSWREISPYCILPNGVRIDMPWVPVLVDLTFVLIALSFCLRLPARTRATNGWVVSFSLLTGFAPLLLLWIAPIAGWFDAAWEEMVNAFMWRTEYRWQQALALGALVTIGNLLDVWGYTALCRSFSIVPEARELKTNGPYRFVRHPVYLGQFLAQAGVMLISFRFHIVWISVYVLFVAMQLYRSKLEEQVLEATFGDAYRKYRQRTFWFV